MFSGRLSIDMEFKEPHHGIGVIAFLDPAPFIVRFPWADPEPHITLAYYPDATAEDVPSMFRSLFQTIRYSPKMEGFVNGHGVFLNGDERVVYLAPDVPGLAEIRDTVATVLPGYAKNHGWTPHITLAYGRERVDDFGPFPIAIDEITLAFGDEHYPIALADVEPLLESILSEFEVDQAIIESLQFMAPGQPRDSRGRWSPRAGISVQNSTETIKRMGAAWADKLSDKEVAAFGDYMARDYERINSDLRAHKAPDDTAKAMTAALERATFPGGTIYRQVDGDFATQLAGLKTGAKFTDHGFTSASTDPDTAISRGGIRGVEIRVPWGASAASVASISLEMAEREVIIQRSSVYRVASNSGTKTVLELVGHEALS